MSYLVLAYPNLSKKDFDLIQNYRKTNDEFFYKIVEPHFTIIFPVTNISQNDFIEEVKVKSKNIAKFNFVIRCASINKDVFSNDFHVFLVPDEGYSKMVKLHDKLYSGALKDNLKLDLDFIPHIGVGKSKDKLICKKLADQWNEKEFSIEGAISHLTIVNYENNTITKLYEIEL